MREHVVNDLELCVINDGDGDLCGVNYIARVNAIRHGNEALLLPRVTDCAWTMVNRFGTPAPTKAEIKEAYRRICAYYRNHIAEMDADAS